MPAIELWRRYLDTSPIYAYSHCPLYNSGMTITNATFCLVFYPELQCTSTMNRKPALVIPRQHSLLFANEFPTTIHCFLRFNLVVRVEILISIREQANSSTSWSRPGSMPVGHRRQYRQKVHSVCVCVCVCIMALQLDYNDTERRRKCRLKIREEDLGVEGNKVVGFSLPRALCELDLECFNRWGNMRNTGTHYLNSELGASFKQLESNGINRKTSRTTF